MPLSRQPHPVQAAKPVPGNYTLRRALDRKGHNMKIIIILSKKPGIYIRRKVIYKGDWVIIRGLAFFLTRDGRRKWAGIAAATPVNPPDPLPTCYKKHGVKYTEPLTIYHYPEGME